MTHWVQAAEGLRERGSSSVCGVTCVSHAHSTLLSLPCVPDSHAHQLQCQLPTLGWDVKLALLRNLPFLKFQFMFIEKENTQVVSVLLFIHILVSLRGTGV